MSPEAWQFGRSGTPGGGERAPGPRVHRAAWAERETPQPTIRQAKTSTTDAATGADGRRPWQRGADHGAGTAAACPLDKVQRQFRAPAPNRLWLSDFTYVSTRQGFAYVAFIIDCSARLASYLSKYISKSNEDERDQPHRYRRSHNIVVEETIEDHDDDDLDRVASMVFRRELDRDPRFILRTQEGAVCFLWACSWGNMPCQSSTAVGDKAPPLE